jgi:monoterpene epsilon-lactone hydrolase
MSIQAKIFSMIMRYQMADFYRDLSVEAQRAKMEKYAKAIKLPDDMTCKPAKGCPVPAEWVTSPEVNDDQVILSLHGGAYFLNYGNPHRNFAARIGRSTQIRVLIPNFRLSPEHPYPAALQDVTVAYQWLLAQGYSPINIAITGESSGGGLVLATLLRLRDEDISFPAAVVCICPWVDLTGSGASMESKKKADFINNPEHMKTTAKLYAGDHDLKDPYISPLYADLSGFPPLLIQAAARDVLLDDATRLAEQARKANVDVTLEVWEEMIHVFQLSAGFVPEARKATENIATFLQQHVGEKN